VYLSGDNDRAGQAFLARCGELLAGHVKDLRVLQCPNGSKDWTEWADAGGTAAAFKALLEGATPYSKTPKEQEGIVLVAAHTVMPHAIQWAWASRIPVGGTSALVGLPDQGKSLLTCALAAQWSTGAADGAWKANPVGVLIASAEDSPETTIVPRLMAAGADLTKVHFVQIRHDGVTGNIRLPDDVAAITARMRDIQAKALIVDPFLAHVPVQINAHRDQHVRLAMAPLKDLAEACQAVAVLILHLNKGEAREVLARIGGSIGIPAAVRSILLAGPDPDDPDGPGKMLAHVKCNVGVKQETLRYEIQGTMVTLAGGDTIAAAHIQWQGVATGVFGTDLLRQLDRDERSATDEAKEWLKATLAEGSKEAETLFENGARLGFCQATLRRAGEALGIHHEKRGWLGPWVWVLPPDAEDAHGGAQDAQSSES